MIFIKRISDNLDTLPANEFNQAGNDLRFLFEVDSSNGSTKGSESRAGDSRLTTTIEDNFFYQHMFNFALVVILLLQVIVVWAFIWCRLSKIGNQPINPSQPSLEDGIALNEINQLPELIPQHHEEMEQNDNGAPAAGAVNRCGRYG